MYFPPTPAKVDILICSHESQTFLVSLPEGFQLTLPRSLEDSHLWQLQPYEM